jgi:heme/copper-type cytochrome/quinol oxidase subunit 4
VDGVTGNIHVDVPKSVRNKRILNVLKIFAIIIAIMAVVYGIWWLGAEVLNWWY